MFVHYNHGNFTWSVLTQVTGGFALQIIYYDGTRQFPDNVSQPHLYNMVSYMIFACVCGNTNGTVIQSRPIILSFKASSIARSTSVCVLSELFTLFTSLFNALITSSSFSLWGFVSNSKALRSWGCLIGRKTGVDFTWQVLERLPPNWHTSVLLKLSILATKL